MRRSPPPGSSREVRSRAGGRLPFPFPAEADPAAIEAHFALEQELARQLLESRPEERSRLFRQAYETLFRSVPAHPQLGDAAAEPNRAKLAYLVACLPRQGAFAELGCGDGRFLLALARPGRPGIGLDVAGPLLALAARARTGGHAFFVQADILAPPLCEGGLAAIISSQLIEHIHPDDVPRHLRQVFELLRPGGILLLDTPNRVSGPHDVSQYFAPKACGFHLREYTIRDLTRLLRSAGFRSIRSPLLPPRLAGYRAALVRAGLAPARLKIPAESLLERVSDPQRARRWARRLLLGNIYLVARRPGARRGGRGRNVSSMAR